MNKLGIKPAVIVAVAVLAGLVLSATSALGDVSAPYALGCFSAPDTVGDHSLYCASSGSDGFFEDVGAEGDVLALAATGRPPEALIGISGLLALMAGVLLRRRAARSGQRARL